MPVSSSRQGKPIRIFTRTWWRIENGERIPEPGRKTTIAYCDTVEEARAYCADWLKKNNPGPRSRKAEFEDA